MLWIVAFCYVLVVYSDCVFLIQQIKPRKLSDEDKNKIELKAYIEVKHFYTFDKFNNIIGDEKFFMHNYLKRTAIDGDSIGYLLALRDIVWFHVEYVDKF